MAGLKKVDEELSDELEKWSKMLSEREKGSDVNVDGDSAKDVVVTVLGSEE